VLLLLLLLRVLSGAYSTPRVTTLLHLSIPFLPFPLHIIAGNTHHVSLLSSPRTRWLRCCSCKEVLFGRHAQRRVEFFTRSKRLCARHKSTALLFSVYLVAESDSKKSQDSTQELHQPTDRQLHTMESYKDVIVSQPPAMYAQSGYTTQFSVENYKGILLCERPSNLGSVAGGGGGGSSGTGVSSTPFIPSNPTRSPVGLAPSKEARAVAAEHVARRVSNQKQHHMKSFQALSRHRRWLRSFAKQMKSMKESDRQCEVEAARRAARIRENEQQKRADQQRQQQVDAAASSQSAASAPYNMRTAMEGHVSAMRHAATAKEGRKPKWAMTAEEAMDDELDIDRDLLDFAEHLDYEKFITDLEVAEALGVMRDRVVHIAKANGWSVEDIRRSNAEASDEDELDSVVTPSEAQVLQQRRPPQTGSAAANEARPALPGSYAAHTHDWDSSTGRGRLLKKAISSDAVALAERLFAASPSLQKIHTKQSLARVLQYCALEGNTDVTEAMLLKAGGKSKTAASPPLATASPAVPKAVPEPVVVQVSADAVPSNGAADGSSPSPPRILRELQQSKERTQGLPYLYRCPAI
jgi:hypothetical protein